MPQRTGTNSKSAEPLRSQLGKRSLDLSMQVQREEILSQDDKVNESENETPQRSVERASASQKKRIAKAFEKEQALNAATSGSKTYIDQIFDFIRVYDPKFMAIKSESGVSVPQPNLELQENTIKIS